MEITAPYTFVPPSTRIRFVTKELAQGAWADAPSQDHPYADGVCGELHVTATAETPVFVRGTEAKAQPYRTPLGYALPGSSVRGMLRSIVEIASFSRLGPVNDDRHGFRDLQNRDLYGNHMAGLFNGTITPFVTAGWLQRRPSSALNLPVSTENAGEPVADIELVNFAKVEYGILERFWKHPQLRIGDRANAPERYRAYDVNPGDDPVELKGVSIAHPAIRPHNSRVGDRLIPGDYTVARPGSAVKVAGHLVITGQPSPYEKNRLRAGGAGNPKHHDFLFYGPKVGAKAVTRAQFRDFEFVHRAEREKHGVRVEPNPEWAFWRGRFEAGKRVPVFCMVNAAGELQAFGLAMMFRLAYANTTLDAVRNAQPTHASSQLDFTESVFGTVRRSGAGAVKGRVAVTTFQALGNPSPGAEVRAVLGGPKPTFYPNYIENGRLDDAARGPLPAGAGAGGRYATLMDKNARVRGWKRYRPQDAVTRPLLPEKSKENQHTTFHPLPAGTAFAGTVKLHNLRPHELGALLWALDFGGDATARHGIGLAKPLGYGRLRLHVQEGSLRRNDGGTLTLSDARAAFAVHMEEWCRQEAIPGGWALSLPLQSLLESARPLAPGKNEPHLLLRNANGKNEFIEAKKERLVLRPPLSYPEWADRLRKAGMTPPVSSGGASGPSVTPAAGGTGPVTAAAAAPVAALGPAADLRQAYRTGKQWALLTQWAQEGDKDRAERVRAAREVLGPDLEKKGPKYPAVMEWIRG